jgi:hypothetical protein
MGNADDEYFRETALLVEESQKMVAAAQRYSALGSRQWSNTATFFSLNVFQTSRVGEAAAPIRLSSTLASPKQV